VFGFLSLLTACIAGGLGAPWGAVIFLAAILSLPRLQLLASNTNLDFAPQLAISFLNNAVFTLLSFGLGHAVSSIVL